MLLIEYSKCTTCSRAKRWLDDHGADYQTRHITEENPTYEELKEWYPRSGLPIKRLFNTSGLIYRSIKLSQLLEGMSEDGKLRLLAGDAFLFAEMNPGQKQEKDQRLDKAVDAMRGKFGRGAVKRGKWK